MINDNKFIFVLLSFYVFTRMSGLYSSAFISFNLLESLIDVKTDEVLCRIELRVPIFMRKASPSCSLVTFLVFWPSPAVAVVGDVDDVVNHDFQPST